MKEEVPNRVTNASPLGGGWVGASLEDYLLAHISPEDDYLHRLYRATNVQLLRPRMASGHLQGQLLRMLTEMIRPHTVVEVGTYSGYATLSIAAALAPDATIHTFEVNDEQEAWTRPWFDASPYAERIKFHIGDVADLLPTLGLTNIDMAFIDGNKRDYCDYYRLLLPRLRRGGYLLADNTLWDGHVIDPAYDHDAQTIGIRHFNDLVAADTAVEKVIIPVRDGLTLIKKL